MVFVKDFRREFYDVIQHQRILVLVAFDVDALCACKILQYLFRCDHVLYTIVPVAGRQDFERAFVEHSEGVRYVVMINCGATLDTVETLQPADGVIFFICDNHRPVDVHNVYNQIQVKLLMKDEEFSEVPPFDEMFRDDDESEEEDGNDSDSSEPSEKRKRFDEDALEKKRQRRLWEENRTRRLFEYTEFSSYGSSSALLMFEMAWKMSKDTNDLLWLAIAGSTSQYLGHQVERDRYIEDVGHLQSHVSRLNQRSDDDENSISIDCLKIVFDQELQLCMYRHWSLLESMCHSEYIACRFKVWTMKGRKRLHEFLADMGLPLVQCKQKFVSMDVNLKETMKEIMAKQAEKYSIEDQSLFLPSFCAHYGYKNRFCAADVVYAAEAVLENIEKDNSSSDNFLKSLDVLNRSRPEFMERGLVVAKAQQSAIVSQVQSFLDMNQIISAGPFLYAFVQQGTAECRFFMKPLCLCRLAKFTLQAYCASMSRSKKVRHLPLVLGAPLDNEQGTMLVVGIPPASNTSHKNFFGKAFEQASSSTNCRSMQDHFAAHILELKTEDKSKFFDALINLLQ